MPTKEYNETMLKITKLLKDVVNPMVFDDVIEKIEHIFIHHTVPYSDNEDVCWDKDEDDWLDE